VGAGQRTEAPNAEVRRTLGRYRLYDVIAAGGMATVHYGRLHGELGFARTVAVKRLHGEYARDPEFVAMFIDEARLSMRVQHPNVVQTLDVVASEGELLLVMEYVPAVSLWQLLRVAGERGQPVPAPVAAAVVADALRGLHAAHEATDEEGNPLDIVHRDVSPQNILVGSDGIARVLDFGVAKASGRQQTTREGQVKGKFAYMAPEQITNVRITRQSDVFAASIVLWEALTGKRLFQAESETALLARVLSAPVEPPSAVVAGLDAKLDRIVLQGLARDLEARYATARDMALDLETHVTLPSPSQVAEWAHGLTGDDLARRAARVAEIENESRSERVSVTTVLASAGSERDGQAGDAPSRATEHAGARRGSRRTILGIAAAGALGAAAVSWWLASGPLASTHVAPFAPAASLAAGAQPSASAPNGRRADNTPALSPFESIGVPSAQPPTAEPDPAPASRSAASKGKPSSAPAPRSGAPAGPAAIRGRCDPPYYLDPGGHLIYKAECFR
jgi:serine/threonine-protein kinase